MKEKRPLIHSGVQELCRKLKDQLEELAIAIETKAPDEELLYRAELLERLKQQLAELSQ